MHYSHNPPEKILDGAHASRFIPVTQGREFTQVDHPYKFAAPDYRNLRTMPRRPDMTEEKTIVGKWMEKRKGREEGARKR